MKKENSISRRSFLKSSAMAGALGAIGTGSAASVVLTSCGGGEKADVRQNPLEVVIQKRTGPPLYRGRACHLY